MIIIEKSYIIVGILTFINNEYHINFPDFHGIKTSSSKFDEVILTSTDKIGMYIVEKEKLENYRLNPTKIEDVDIKENQKTVTLIVWMPYYREKYENKMYKKTLTIPSWINAIGEKNGINFSQLLTTAIKDKLDIKEESL